MIHKKRTAPRAAGPIKGDSSSKDEKPNPSRIEAQDVRSIIADWLRDWHVRAQRAQLALELIGAGEEHDRLLREGRAIKRVMAKLCGGSP